MSIFSWNIVSGRRHSRQENLSAIAGTIGDAIVPFTKDAPGALAFGLFLPTEAVIYLWGDTAAGYSAGMLGLAAGDTSTCFSNAVAGNLPMECIVGTLAASLLVGAARYPAGKIAVGLRRHRASISRLFGEAAKEKTAARITSASRNILKVAVKIKPFVASFNSSLLLLSIPVAAYTSGQRTGWIMPVAVSFWIAQDLMLGRAQRLFRKPLHLLKNFLSPRA